MRLSLAITAVGLAVGVLLFLVTGGKVVFLPLLLLLPLGVFRLGRRR